MARPTSTTSVLPASLSPERVIPLLQAKGFRVTSVAIPLTSFADDVAATKRAIAAQQGPLILVGHSYGGVVITETGTDPKVAGLDYVAAFAPDAGQSITDISKPFPKPAGLDKLGRSAMVCSRYSRYPRLLYIQCLHRPVEQKKYPKVGEVIRLWTVPEICACSSAGE